MTIALKITQLSKIYPNGLHALKGIDLTIQQGDFFALLGANGAGKSTTIGLLTTLLRQTSGTIEINTLNLTAYPEKAKALMGVVPQEFNINIFETCEQVLYNQAGYYGISRSQAKNTLENLLNQLGLSDKRHDIVRHLSGGMKRRLMIARALMHQPKILILDEPTAGIDVEIRRNMWDFLKELNTMGTTIILTTHYLEEAEQLCKHVAILHEGRIIENTSIQALLSTLNQQTFILNTKTPLHFLPDLPHFPMTLIDTHTIELQVPQTISLNQLFEILTQHDLEIYSISTKTNRLETLFMHRIKHVA